MRSHPPPESYGGARSARRGRAARSLSAVRASGLKRIASAAGARTRGVLRRGHADGDRAVRQRTMHRDGPFDAWLSLFDDRLTELDAACEREGLAALRRFRELDDDLWTVLLTRGYERYPAIRGLMPRLPSPELQLRWNGAVGLELLTQGKVFYRRAKAAVARHGRGALGDAAVLDFGCGWGRLTRFFIRDLEPGSLFGCDTAESILDFCRGSGLPAEFALCDPRPERLPFDRRFDLILAFSVFTHLSEPAHEACLRAIHAALAPGGLFLATIRSPAYLTGHELGRSLLEQLDDDPLRALERPRYLFSAHPAEPGHPQYRGGEMDYGETVISLPYVRKRWSELFEPLDVALLTEDMHQVALALRRRD
jgi:SAM-dependent methyltransferase